jgi:signal transduction histidine kinase/CheY-like chemotaxis protein
VGMVILMAAAPLALVTALVWFDGTVPRPVVLISGLAFLAGAVLTLVFAGDLSARLLSLAAAAGAMQRGERPAIATRSPVHEVSVLAQALEAAIDAIGERADGMVRAEAGRREAEAANRARDDFLAILSHELRTPLNAMLLRLEVLREGRGDLAHARRAVEAIERSCRQQAKLIDDVVDAARISSGQFSVELRSVELLPIVRAAADAMADGIAGKRIRLTTDLEAGRCQLLGDPERLQQALTNLLSNAVRFTPSEGAIAVRAERRGQLVTVSVQDTGEGIAPEVIGRIFDRVALVGGGTRRHGGLGLGVAIARAIVECHEGRITVSSGGHGQGATFTVALPVTVTEDENARGAPPGPGAATAPSPPSMAGRNPRASAASGEEVTLVDRVILLVEDDEDARELVGSALRSLGARVVAVASSLEALETLNRIRPHVLVSDIGMPELDGYELIRRVRRASVAGARLPAVALTAFTSPADRARAFSAGYQAHIPKPVDIRRLATVISDLASSPA